jgi:hypothetical protein
MQINPQRGLVALNVVLLMVLAAITLAPSSIAQKQPAGRARGEYSMVSGKFTGGNSHAIYVFDANNQELLAMAWNQTSKGLEAVGYRDLHADASGQPTR